jgi:putative oxidoreductase
MKKFKNPDVAILILRVFVGAIFITHGLLKLTNVSDTQAFFQMLGMAPWIAVVVGVVEVLAGLSIALGYFTVVSTIAIAIIMLAAIFKVKLPMAGIMSAEVDLAMLVSVVVIFITGPGKYSIGNKCGCAGKCGCDKSKCNIADACKGKACDMNGCGCDCHK